MNLWHCVCVEGCDYGSTPLFWRQNQAMVDMCLAPAILKEFHLFSQEYFFK